MPKFRRFIAPAILTLITFVLDTTLLPSIYRGVYSVSLTLVMSMLIGITAGRVFGLLFGTIGGLLLDITTGTLGMMTFYFMAAGFLAGLMLSGQSASALPTRSNRRRLITRRVLCLFLLTAAGEIVLLILQYFYTAHMAWSYVLNLLVRSAVVTALSLLLLPPVRRFVNGFERVSASAPGRRASAADARQKKNSSTRKREVKSF